MTARLNGDWNGRWVGDRLGIELVDAQSNFDSDADSDANSNADSSADSAPALPLADLVGLALRRNPRRAHLLVSSVLGKHVPTDPRIVDGAGLLLGALVGAHLKGDGFGARAVGVPMLAAALATDGEAARRLAAYAPGGLVPDAVVLGFAETATALGHCVAVSLGCRYVHSTRRTGTGVDPVATFAEEHSHAVDHLVLAKDRQFLAGNGPFVLVDDELSTGRTARNTIRALHARWPHQRYVIASLVDLRAPADRRAMTELAQELKVAIDVVSLATGRIELPAHLRTAAAAVVESLPVIAASQRAAGTVEALAPSWPATVAAGARYGMTSLQTAQLHRAAADVAGALAERLDPGSVLVLGTEELMYAPLRIAGALADLRADLTVRFSTTTRSPAVAVDEPGYALRTALTFRDPDGGPEPRFAYNVADDGWDTVVVVIDDAMVAAARRADDLVPTLARHAARVVVVTLPERATGWSATSSAPRSFVAAMLTRWLSTSSAPRSFVAAMLTRGTDLPVPMRGPDFGSYPADDVGWLLTDLSDVDLEAPTEQREEAIQSGAAHYAQSLPIEYQPSGEYQQLFRSALEESAYRIAVAVGIVTEMVLADRGEHAVVASLARAGTPVGVLMRRWAEFAHGLNLPHYALSIVRGRGIDPVALQYLGAHHDPSEVIFVDGWTGKGAIVRELAAAVDQFNRDCALAPFAPEVAVLADPGGCVSLFGTRDDFLIPSACLNSTVSGLVSRTVLNDALIGPGQFHGAKFYAELTAADVSMAFVDRIAAEFASARTQVDGQWPSHYASDRRATWSGWAAVEAISARYGIGDVNLVKPGVGETTRVLLRRVPWRILIRPDARAELAHVELLAAQRGVDIESVADLPYSCVGLIHPRFSRGATGADGRRARE